MRATLKTHVCNELFPDPNAPRHTGLVPLTIETAEAGGATVLAARGSMTLGPELIQFAATARNIVEDCPIALVLDIANVQQVDSAGLGELVKIYSSAARSGILFALAGASPRLREIMAITHVDVILESYPDRQSALAGLKRRASS